MTGKKEKKIRNQFDTRSFGILFSPVCENENYDLNCIYNTQWRA